MCSSVYKTHSEVPGGYKHNEGIRAYSVLSSWSIFSLSLSLSLSPPPSLPPHRSTEERLGDVICRLAPFLKLYSHYTSGFEEAMKTLTECTKKDKKFDAIVRDFEVSQLYVARTTIHVIDLSPLCVCVGIT